MSELQGWKAIAARLGVSINPAQRYARLDEDRLPVEYENGRVVISEAAIAAWKSRRRLTFAERRAQIAERRAAKLRASEAATDTGSRVR